MARLPMKPKPRKRPRIISTPATVPTVPSWPVKLVIEVTMLPQIAQAPVLDNEAFKVPPIKTTTMRVKAAIATPTNP